MKQRIVYHLILLGFLERCSGYYSDQEIKPGTGFRDEWINDGCGGHIQRSFGLVSVNASVNSSGVIECEWLVETSIGSRISLVIAGFYLSVSQNCTVDAIEIYNGQDIKSPLLTKVCHRTSSKLVQSTENFMFIRFVKRSELIGTYFTLSLTSTKAAKFSSDQQALCDGQLLGLRGDLVSPDLGKSYNCDWNHKKVKVVLRTEDTTHMGGFKALWTPICGGHYIASENEQILYSPRFPNRYTPMMDCSYEITAPENETLILKFEEFELEGSYPECQNGNLTINVDSNYDYSKTVYCGSKKPSIITGIRRASLSLKSDKFDQRKGFKMSFAVNKCGGHVKEPTSLTVLTSNTNKYYDENMNCTWLIQAPPDKIVVLKFLYIDLQNYDCVDEYVAVFDDLFIDNNRRLALLCGYINSTTVLRSHSSQMLLQFASHQYVSNNGFKVEVVFSYPESQGCGGQVDLTTYTSKTIKSFVRGNNTNYDSFLDCHWKIISPPDTIVKINFTRFNIASCKDNNQTELGQICECDYVEIKDGINPDSLTIGTFCGHTIPPIFYSSGNFLSFRLSTDGEIESKGFEVQLSVQQSLCGKSRISVTDTIQHIKSPGFDSGIIPRGLHCIYYLDPGPRTLSMIRISFNTLDLQSATNQGAIGKCNNDKLEIVDYHISRNISLGKDYVMNEHETRMFDSYSYFEEVFPSRFELCGSKKPSDLYVTGSMAVKLTTSPKSDSNTYKGFEFEIAFASFCGRNYTETQGKIQTPYNIYFGPSEKHTKLETCYTLITAPENHTISVYFINISPDYWNVDSYLNIYDGNDVTSAKLVSIKREHANEYPVFSTGRYMLLHSHRENEITMYYDMNYVTTDKGRGCGGKLINEYGKITSPMYPDVYRKQSTCEWELETPFGTRIKLRFSVFELGTICDQNYLQLIDSKGNVISNYCSEPPATYTSNDNFVKIVFNTSVNNGGRGWVADFVGII